MRLTVKYLILLTQPLLLLLLLLKIKYLVLVIQSKKTVYNTNICEIEKKITDHNHKKYITTPEFNKFTTQSSASTLKRANLVSKSNIANFVNDTDFDNKLKGVTSNKSNNNINNYINQLLSLPLLKHEHTHTHTHTQTSVIVIIKKAIPTSLHKE